MTMPVGQPITEEEILLWSIWTQPQRPVDGWGSPETFDLYLRGLVRKDAERRLVLSAAGLRALGGDPRPYLVQDVNRTVCEDCGELQPEHAFGCPAATA